MKKLFVKVYYHVSMYSSVYILGTLITYAWLDHNYLHWASNEWGVLASIAPIVVFLFAGLHLYEKWK
jgi:hypothetical protein